MCCWIPLQPFEGPGAVATVRPFAPFVDECGLMPRSGEGK
jgi:hypothetical protein